MFVARVRTVGTGHTLAWGGRRQIPLWLTLIALACLLGEPLVCRESGLEDGWGASSARATIAPAPGGAAPSEHAPASPAPLSTAGDSGVSGHHAHHGSFAPPTPAQGADHTGWLRPGDALQPAPAHSREFFHPPLR